MYVTNCIVCSTAISTLDISRPHEFLMRGKAITAHNWRTFCEDVCTMKGKAHYVHQGTQFVSNCTLITQPGHIDGKINKVNLRGGKGRLERGTMRRIDRAQDEEFEFDQKNSFLITPVSLEWPEWSKGGKVGGKEAIYGSGSSSGGGPSRSCCIYI